MFKAKIVIVGPSGCGKTAVANHLGDQIDQLQSEYIPTAGVRILEFESQVNNGSREVEVEVEMWDCGGGDEYEGCWPAMAAGADGVIIMYNPFEPKDKGQLQNLFSYFVTGQGLREECSMVFAHCKRKDATRNISSPLQNVPFHATNLDSDQKDIEDHFKKLLEKVLLKLSESREKEELSIIS